MFLKIFTLTFFVGLMLGCGSSSSFDDKWTFDSDKTNKKNKFIAYAQDGQMVRFYSFRIGKHYDGMNIKDKKFTVSNQFDEVIDKCEITSKEDDSHGLLNCLNPKNNFKKNSKVEIKDGELIIYHEVKEKIVTQDHFDEYGNIIKLYFN